jgi:hypothetical protein
MTRTLVALSIGMFGCQDGVEAPPASVSEPQGLTILSADRAAGLTGTYREGDLIVQFETITDPLNERADHRAVHGIAVTRPMFSSRWSDGEDRTIAVELSGSSVPTDTWIDVDPTFDKLPPAQWDDLLDLTKKAATALQAQTFSGEVEEERAKLVSMIDDVPSRAERVLPVTDDQLAQIEARQTTDRGWLGYQWFQSFAVAESFFHQCTVWKNYRYINGAWAYYDSVTELNGANCDEYKCGFVSTVVHDYKGKIAQCDYGDPTYYGMDDGRDHHYNCRSSALLEQTWVLGNTLCSTNSQASVTMCRHEEDPLGGAYCGVHSTCTGVNWFD